MHVLVLKLIKRTCHAEHSFKHHQSIRVETRCQIKKPSFFAQTNTILLNFFDIETSKLIIKKLTACGRTERIKNYKLFSKMKKKKNNN